MALSERPPRVRLEGQVALVAGAGRGVGRAIALALSDAGAAVAELEPPLRENEKRDFRRLTGLLEQPLALLGDRAPAKPVWHCAIRAAPGDPDSGDGAWMRIAAEIMDRIGLSQREEEYRGVRWVAVHHGQNHIHIVATLARMDGRRAGWTTTITALARPCAISRPTTACRWWPGPSRKRRPEQEKAARPGRPGLARVTLYRQVAAAAAGTRSKPEFFRALDKRGLRVRLRRSTHNPAKVTVYAVGLLGDLTGAGEQIWYGGGKLAPDLTLPKLRHRWPEPGRRAQQQHDQATGPRPRLDGHGKTAGSARAALRREVNMCGAAARNEPEFFTDLERIGLLVRLHYDIGRPGEVTGYAFSLPGLVHHWDGQQVWYGGQTLDQQLSLAAMRLRWQAVPAPRPRSRPSGPPTPWTSSTMPQR